jgi:hypothetical protein
MTYGWMLIVVGVVGDAFITAVSGPHPRSVMPSDFNYSESKQTVEEIYGGNCESSYNSTYSDYYGFECSEIRGNFTYIVSARVEYNETGPDEVYLYE